MEKAKDKFGYDYFLPWVEEEFFESIDTLKKLENPKITRCCTCLKKNATCLWERTKKNVFDGRLTERSVFCEKCGNLLLKLKQQEISINEYHNKAKKLFAENLKNLEEKYENTN
jgi:hypothetical protein